VREGRNLHPGNSVLTLRVTEEKKDLGFVLSKKGGVGNQRREGVRRSILITS